ncbi:MAG: methyl-accepting chemotaxis protein [Spirochaetota bacterium]|nr:methyl-accepting chemotaxis protein [Spirochaetota bacterium]
MNSSRSMTVAKRLILGFGIITTVLIIVAVVSIIGLSSSTAGFDHYRELARDNNLMGRIQANLLKGRLDIKDFMISGSQKNVDEYKKDFKKTEEFITTAKKDLELKDDAKKINEMDSLLKQYNNTFAELVQAKGEGKVEITNKKIEELNTIGPKAAKIVEDLKLGHLKEQDILGPTIKANNKTTITIVIVVSIVAFGASVFLTFLTTKQIKKPLGGEPTVMANIAEKVSSGDLTMEFVKDAKTSGLYLSIVDMTENLKKVIGEIAEVSTNLAASSEEINATAANLAEGAQNQSASVEETSSATEELVSSIKQVSGHAITMKDKSERSLSEAQTYKINMQQISEEMNNLSSSTEKIGDIIKVINDIADQTNLLSLNAAIEAARAGEHGRGFAVVAEAISTLATRSAASTKEIELLIRDSIDRINKGVSSVKQSSDSFQAIIDTIEENNKLVSNIARSMEEQSTGSEQIQKATEEVNNLTQSASASAEELSSSTSELHNLAERLNQIVGTFKISGNGNREVKYTETNAIKHIEN